MSVTSTGICSGIGDGQVVGKLVIDITMNYLVCADHNNDVSQACAGRKLPVVDGDLGCRYIFVGTVTDLTDELVRCWIAAFNTHHLITHASNASSLSKLPVHPSVMLVR